MVLPFGISSSQHNPSNSGGGGGGGGGGVGSGASTGLGSGPGAGISSGTTADLTAMMPATTALYPNPQGNLYIPSPYIDFIVVNGDDRYVVRCEKLAVLENSVELAKYILLACGPSSGRKIDNHLKIFDVNKLDFELLIRFLETKTIKFNDHHHILKILELADRFNCPDLIIHCVRELDLRLTSATVIDILRSIYFYHDYQLPASRLLHNTISPEGCTSRKKENRKSKEADRIQAEQPANCSRNFNFNSNTNFNFNSNSNSISNTTNKSSVKSKNTNSSTKTKSNQISGVNEQPFTAQDYSVALLNNALQLIDMHAELILVKPEINDLRFEELQMIVTRDALMLTSELTLFTCLANWSTAECKRKNLDATAENRRKVLGPLCYSIRYALMTIGELRKAMERVELLNPAEISIITDVIEGRKPTNLTSEQIQLLEKFSCIRPEFAKMPVHLSDRSNPKSYPKKMRSASTSDDCFDNYGLNCLTILACLFD